MSFDLLILRDRSDQFGVIPAEVPRPRAGIHNPTPCGYGFRVRRFASLRGAPEWRFDV